MATANDPKDKSGQCLSVRFINLGVSILPVLWTITTALMNWEQVMLLPPKLIPSPIYWGNFEKVIRSFISWSTCLKLVKEFIDTDRDQRVWTNSVFCPGGIWICTLPFSSTQDHVRINDGYIDHSIHRKDRTSRHMFASWGWTNSYLPITVPSWFGGAFLIFLFYQYFCTIPRSLDENAMLDGATPLRIFFSIILPLSTPILATAVVLTFMSNWNLFLEPYIYLHDVYKYPLAVVLGYDRMAGSLSPFRAAFILFYSLPVVLIFFLLQHYFVKGIQISIIKE